MRRIAVLLLVIVTSQFVSACATARPGHWTERCDATPPANVVPLTPDRLPLMVGSFRVTLVTTSYKASPMRSEVELFAVDSTTRLRAGQPRVGRRPRADVRLIGVDYWNRQSPADAAEWDDGVLFLGCRDCFDASPHKLRVGAVTEDGFWGWWVNEQSGTVRVVDRHGAPTPNPAGYFCARRVK
jgi:hypothetical protein